MEGAISMAFSRIDAEVFLLVLYRNNELRLWSVSTLQSVASYSCTEYQGAQGRKFFLLNLTFKYIHYLMYLFSPK